MMRPLLCCQMTPLLRARCPYNSHSCGSRELKSCDPNAATGPVDKDDFCRYRPCALEKGAIGRAIRHIQGCTLGEGDYLGQGVYLRLEAKYLLGIGSADSPSNVNPIADFETFHP